MKSKTRRACACVCLLFEVENCLHPACAHGTRGYLAISRVRAVCFVQTSQSFMIASIVQSAFSLNGTLGESVVFTAKRNGPTGHSFELGVKAFC
ncbi:hypothetical protein RB3848 [Rhodopirellula baltica SH 1]|uniref:Uncharacterized protein n=2 Tax=Rhodopirellula baltica TaxID=265606 RepID=Q7UTJ2_RHOBA|nr:hypothetical protein RB3848 [Rhodopirellula baltica SH 1]